MLRPGRGGKRRARAHQAVPLGYVRYYVGPIASTPRSLASRPGPNISCRWKCQLSADAQLRRARFKGTGGAVVPARRDTRARRPRERFPDADDPRPRELTAAIRASADATVEGLAQFSAAGTIESLGVTRLPPLPAALLYRHATYERLAIEAAQRPQRANLLRAMLANPMIATAHQATVLTDVLQGCLAQETSDDAAEAGQS